MTDLNVPQADFRLFEETALQPKVKPSSFQFNSDINGCLLMRVKFRSGVDGYIAERKGSAPDHTMTISFPEGEYLEGLVMMSKL